MRGTAFAGGYRANDFANSKWWQEDNGINSDTRTEEYIHGKRVTGQEPRALTTPSWDPWALAYDRTTVTTGP